MGIMNDLNIILSFLLAHPLGFFSSVTTFIISCWSGYIDGLPPKRVLINSLVCVIFTFALMGAINREGHHQYWLPLVGVIMGVIGVERFRDVILSIWKILKKRYIP